MTNGSLACFGRNVQGELGVGDQAQHTTPAVVDFGGPVERLAAGGDFTCAGGTDAVLKCWGTNTFGQLGNGTTDRALKPTPVPALGSRVGRIATGGAHACAITTDDGHVHCWGDNRSGQLGTGDTQRKLTPVEVDPQNLGAVRTNSLFAGGVHTCALRDDNTFWCWGGNRFGQLGTGDTQPHLTPTKVLDNVTAAYTGGAHTCAVLTDGSVKCWGNNQYGQLGAEVGSESLTPTTVLGACTATTP
jgi:alpha-tubulin suppressor-like RCC1 family protein